MLRSEEEMLDIILHTARSDDRILAAYLKGSRTNPNVPKDIYRDFDLMYVVKETESFRTNLSWMEPFGRIILKQEQKDAFGYGERFGIQSHYEDSYSWLLLFEDGNRIDVGVETLETMQEGRNRNRLFLPLLDKTGCLPKLPPPTDEEFYIRKPTEEKFLGCCNEFYWSLCDTVKGIARDELPFAMTTYHTLAHSMLEVMLGWYVGSRMDFYVSCGKLNKYFKKYLPEEFYMLYRQTYTDGEYGHFWKAVETSCRLFKKAAILTGEALGYTYPQDEEEGFKKYMEIIRKKEKL